MNSEQKALAMVANLRKGFCLKQRTTFDLPIMGGIVRVTGSGLGCPDWPTCHGQLIPPMRMDAIIEYLHRLIAALTSPLILASAIVGWWKFRAIKWVSRPPIIAVGLLIVEIILGAAGLLYLVSALALGGGLIYQAWALRKHGGNKPAWNMYKYSSMYLAVLMIALMADALIRSPRVQ